LFTTITMGFWAFDDLAGDRLVLLRDAVHRVEHMKATSALLMPSSERSREKYSTDDDSFGAERMPAGVDEA